MSTVDGKHLIGQENEISCYVKLFSSDVCALTATRRGIHDPKDQQKFIDSLSLKLQKTVQREIDLRIRLSQGHFRFIRTKKLPISRVHHFRYFSGIRRHAVPIPIYYLEENTGAGKTLRVVHNLHQTLGKGHIKHFEAGLSLTFEEEGFARVHEVAIGTFKSEEIHGVQSGFDAMQKVHEFAISCMERGDKYITNAHILENRKIHRIPNFQCLIISERTEGDLYKFMQSMHVSRMLPHERVAFMFPLFRQLIQQIHTMHLSGFVNRDVKITNLLVRKKEEEEENPHYEIVLADYDLVLSTRHGRTEELNSYIFWDIFEAVGIVTSRGTDILGFYITLIKALTGESFSYDRIQMHERYLGTMNALLGGMEKGREKTLLKIVLEEYMQPFLDALFTLEANVIQRIGKYIVQEYGSDLEDDVLGAYGSPKIFWETYKRRLKGKRSLRFFRLHNFSYRAIGGKKEYESVPGFKEYLSFFDLESLCEVFCRYS